MVMGKRSMKKMQIIRVLTLGFLVIGIFFSVVGISNVISKAKNVAKSGDLDATLANAEMTADKKVDDKKVEVMVSYYDQRQDECVDLYDKSNFSQLSTRQFEWSKCGYHNKKLEQGMVDFYLGDNHLPVSKSGQMLSNRGLDDTARWFSNVDNKSKSYSGALGLKYNTENKELFYEEENFYPLDDASFSIDDGVNKDGHNHLFTMGFAIPFDPTFSGSEGFEIIADDDTFVFIDDKLALDMGGVHEALNGKFVIYEDGEIHTSVAGEDLAYSGITLEKTNDALIRIFHADRDSEESTLRFYLRNMDVKLAKTDLSQSNGKMQVAYDPVSGMFIAPLGVTNAETVELNRSYVVMIIVWGTVIVMLTLLAVRTTYLLVKEK